MGQLFGAVSFTKNADIDKYKYSGYGIGFDRHFYHPSGRTGRNIIIYGVDMNSFTKIDNRTKDILILDKGSTQGLEHTLSEEKMYSFNFTESNKAICLSLHYNGANSYLFVNGREIYKFKAKDSRIVATPLCLGNISKDWTVDNMKKTGLNGYVYDFSADYDAIAIDGILGIHKYLMKNNNMIQKMFRFIEKVFVVSMSSFGCNALKFVSMNYQDCKVRPEIININSNETSFHIYSVKISKCSGSCNNINDPYATLRVPDVVKNMNVKVLNLISRTNETRYIKWPETYKCICRLDASACNNKQRWN